MSELDERKRAARSAAMAVRAKVHSADASRLTAGHALEAIAALQGVRTVSGYLPIRSEIDPLPAMLALAELGFELCVPVMVGRDLPLIFRSWGPGVPTKPGPFGVAEPVAGDEMAPELLLVPMLAFDRRGHRLGYGGGYYDRTIARLRALGPVTALGFAYAVQEVDTVPDSETDMRLDAIVTEAGVIRPG